MPAQAASDFKPSGDRVVYTTPHGAVGYAAIHRLDPEADEVELVWDARCRELDVIPTVVVLNDFVHPKPKPQALSELCLAGARAGGLAAQPRGLALLRRDHPTFVANGGPFGGTFSDDLAEMITWSTQLDHSYVAVQGPPGTGKTYSGAHLVRALIKSGSRVGITAFSHHAIDNFLEEIVKVIGGERELHLLQAVRTRRRKPARADCLASHMRPAIRLRPHRFQSGGRNDMAFRQRRRWRDAPVGRAAHRRSGAVGLADGLAACRSARNLVALGDPLQVPQVVQATHPRGRVAVCSSMAGAHEQVIVPSGPRGISH